MAGIFLWTKFNTKYKGLSAIPFDFSKLSTTLKDNETIGKYFEMIFQWCGTTMKQLWMNLKTFLNDFSKICDDFGRLWND